MRTAIVPSANATWVLREVPNPEPGPNQVLIKIRASGMCYTDVHQARGEIPGPFPRTLGHEPVGAIVAIGVGVTTRKVADRVGVPWVQSSCGRCEWCFRGKAMFCAGMLGTSMQLAGGHAEYMLAHADATMLIPEGLSFEQAAPIFCAGYTVWSGLRWAAPQPGERVAVVGVGGLGHLAVQYAKAAGFHTIAVSHSPDKDQLIRDLGADEIVRDGAGLAGAGGADIVLGTSNSMDATADSIDPGESPPWRGPCGAACRAANRWRLDHSDVGPLREPPGPRRSVRGRRRGCRGGDDPGVSSGSRANPRQRRGPRSYRHAALERLWPTA